MDLYFCWRCFDFYQTSTLLILLIMGWQVLNLNNSYFWKDDHRNSWILYIYLYIYRLHVDISNSIRIGNGESKYTRNKLCKSKSYIKWVVYFFSFLAFYEFKGLKKKALHLFPHWKFKIDFCIKMQFYFLLSNFK